MVSSLVLGVAMAGAPSIEEPPITGAKAPNDMAVVIANEAYIGGFGAVPYAMRDANAFAAWLTRTRGLPRVNVARVNGASRKGIADAVSKAAANVPPGGTLWVYYAGHGLGMQLEGSDAPERVLLGINAISQAEELPEYVVPISQLERIAASSKAAQTVFVLDACFNNAGRDGESLVSGRFAIPVRDLAASTRVTVWSATSPKETAVPYEPAQHGAFTYFAIGALSGWADGVTSAPDGKVTLDEAQTWVQRAMPAVGLGGQTPQLAGSQGFLASSGALASEPDLPQAVAARINPGASTGSFGYEGDLAAQLKNQACDEEAGRLAEAQAKARGEAAVAKVRSEATASWGRLVPQLEACTKLDDKRACIDAVDRFVTASKAAKVDVAGGVESVTTACGAKTRAVGARSLAVSIPELTDAAAWLTRLKAPPPPPPPKPGTDGRSPTLGVLKWIPGGTFTMGSPVDEFKHRSADETQHQVTLTAGFQIMATEVTQGMYTKLMGTNPSDPNTDGRSMLGDDMPVQNVRFAEVLAFANAASEAEGLTPCYVKDTWSRGCTGYRLPTEAEWERAARGGAAHIFPGTSDPTQGCKYANIGTLGFPDCDDGVPLITAKVGSFRPNGYGLYDMSGNVSEWVWDWYAPYPMGPVTDPTGPAYGSDRVRRGGNVHDSAFAARVASRNSYPGGATNKVIGFRLVRSAP